MKEVKRLLFFLCILIFAFTFFQSKAQARSFTVLPITQQTDQWSVKVSEAKNVKGLARP